MSLLPVGLALGNSALLIANKITGPDFMTVGWRYPFVLSLVLIVIGSWVRLGMLETPIFVRLPAERRVARQPVRQVVTRNGGDIVKLVFVKVVEMSSFYVFNRLFALVRHQDTEARQRVHVAGACGSFCDLPVLRSGQRLLSDLIGRKRMYMMGACSMVSSPSRTSGCSIRAFQDW